MSPSKAHKLRQLNFDIDQYLEPLIPQSRLDRLPKALSHFLGYRDAPRQPIGNVPIAAWSFVGAFAGTAAVSSIFMADFIRDRGGPVIIGSYGAAAILEYNAIESPFSQPRNSMVGQLLAAVVGVGITKLFALSADFDRLRWLAGALSVALSSALMSLTNTIHPPAGATALLAATQPAITDLGWLYVAIVLLCSTVTLAIACLLNNIHRQYPIYWWTPREKITRVGPADAEKAKASAPSGADPGTPGHDAQARTETHDGKGIFIGAEGIFVPQRFYLSPQEQSVVEILAARLRDVKAEGEEEEDEAHEERDEHDDGSHDSTMDASSQSGKSVV